MPHVLKPRATPEDVRLALTTLMPGLASVWARPLREHAAAVYDAAKFLSPSSTRQFALERLHETITRAAARAGYGLEDAQDAAREFRASPVMQTGPHCLLLFEPDAFYTHLFSLMGLRANHRTWQITYAGSTMSFSESAKKGPGWLKIGGEPLNLFGLPRARMDGHSICCSDVPYRFALTNSQGEVAPGAAAKRLLADLPALPFPTAAEAIKVANYGLWRSRFRPAEKLVQLDDFDMADLVADHLEQTGSWLAEVFCANGGAGHLISAIDALNAGPWRGWIRRSTDFFWFVGRNRLRPMELQDGRLTDRGSLQFDVEFSPAGIAEALRQRLLLPSLFTTFLVLSILPGVRALGGCRQVVYLPLMRYLTALAVTRSGDHALLDDLRYDDRPSLWGHRVLRPVDADPYFQLAESAPVEKLLRSYSEMTLIEASGDLGSFVSDPIWGQMSRSLKSGAVGPSALEWAWSGFAQQNRRITRS